MYQTNSNENFNSLLAKFANKSTVWQISYSGRLSASILLKNEPYKCIYEARSNLNLPKLCNETTQVFDKFINSRIHELNNQRSPFVKEARKIKIKMIITLIREKLITNR